MERRKNEFKDESEKLIKEFLSSKEFEEFLSRRRYLSSYEIRELFERRKELFESPTRRYKIILEIEHDDEI
jgi:hypothetical protein